MIQRRQCAGDGVFMKAIAPISTAKIGALPAIDLAVQLLRRQTCRCVQRMRIAQATQHLGRVDIG